MLWSRDDMLFGLSANKLGVRFIVLLLTVGLSDVQGCYAIVYNLVLVSRPLLSFLQNTSWTISQSEVVYWYSNGKAHFACMLVQSKLRGKHLSQISFVHVSRTEQFNTD